MEKYMENSIIDLVLDANWCIPNNWTASLFMCCYGPGPSVFIRTLTIDDLTHTLLLSINIVNLLSIFSMVIFCRIKSVVRQIKRGENATGCKRLIGKKCGKNCMNTKKKIRSHFNKGYFFLIFFPLFPQNDVIIALVIGL